MSKNQKGASAIMLTILIMSAMLFVALTASDIIHNGLQISKIQVHSTKAYYAAEAGAERMLWEIRKNGHDPYNDSWVEGECVFINGSDVITPGSPTLDCDNPAVKQVLSFNDNDAEYRIEYEMDGDPLIPGDASIVFTVIGDRYDETRRVVEISFAYN